MSPHRAALGALEVRVMDVVWDHGAERGPMSVRDVLGEMTGRRPAYTTVMTVLSRLVGKGLLTRTRDGRAWRYLAVRTREQASGAAMRDPLAVLAPEERQAAILHFIEEASPAEIASIRAALAAREERTP